MQSADESKLKAQLWGLRYRWAIGVALCLLALSALAWRQQQQQQQRRGRGPGAPLPRGPWQATPIATSLAAEPAGPGLFGGLTAGLPESGPESLEDALSALEHDWASRATSPTGEGPPKPAGTAAVAEAPRPAKAASAKAGRMEAKPKRNKKEAKAKAAPEEAGSGAVRPQAKEHGGAEVADALAKLEEAPSKSAKGVKKRAAAKELKTSEADREKAQAIIREAFEKLHAAPPEGEDEAAEGGPSLKERLEALVAENEEADRDPDVRKAKAIIKDAMKKIDLPKSGTTKAAAGEKGEEDEGLDTSHIEFAQRLKEEAAQKPAHELAVVKEDFKRDFGADARKLLCSGCKLVAARLHSELDVHDVHEAESPALMLANKRKAIDSTCRGFRHLHVVPGEGGLRFEATEAAESGEVAPGVGQKLCSALLEDAKFELLSALIRRKVPVGSLFHTGEPVSHNWERLLCAQRARVCKRTEVKEDDEEEEL